MEYPGQTHQIYLTPVVLRSEGAGGEVYRPHVAVHNFDSITLVEYRCQAEDGSMLGSVIPAAVMLS